MLHKEGQGQFYKGFTGKTSASKLLLYFMEENASNIFLSLLRLINRLFTVVGRLRIDKHRLVRLSVCFLEADLDYK